MIPRVIDSYLEALTGYIFDEDKLVTYKWLSKELGVHVNLAKQILWEFRQRRGNLEEVTATFALMGYLAGGGLRVDVVKESELPSAKAKFSRLTTEHVYSLQRALPNLELLALTDNGVADRSAIICKEIKPRSEQELSLLRWGSKVPEKSPVISTAPKSTSLASNVPAVKKTERSSFNNLFARSNNEKTTAKQSNTLGESKSVSGKSTDFFRSDSERMKTSPSENVNVNEKSIADSRGQKRQKVEQIKKNSKRRKKGTTHTSSDRESSESEDVESDLPLDPEQPPPPEETRRSVSPPAFKIVNGKRKVRKTIDKTSTDQDGFLVTTKEYVYESCSDKEEEVPKVEPRKSKPTAVAGRKQASLLNFFKKS